ncbi:phosphatidylinositol Kinase [Kipferlia bialata]|uniref:Phosphatidylinositol Kinase n=1 Tax=Kipferlia bialata TaxID=797122 RepID=A0A9K3CT99_9EUKA|nr:phosphatidylinositol Kinase [Kipferlia bialata]|eukprot:g4067.t1
MRCYYSSEIDEPFSVDIASLDGPILYCYLASLSLSRQDGESLPPVPSTPLGLDRTGGLEMGMGGVPFGMEGDMMGGEREGEGDSVLQESHREREREWEGDLDIGSLDTEGGHRGEGERGVGGEDRDTALFASHLDIPAFYFSAYLASGGVPLCATQYTSLTLPGPTAEAQHPDLLGQLGVEQRLHFPMCLSAIPQDALLCVSLYALDGSGQRVLGGSSVHVFDSETGALTQGCLELKLHRNREADCSSDTATPGTGEAWGLAAAALQRFHRQLNAGIVGRQVDSSLAWLQRLASQQLERLNQHPTTDETLTLRVTMPVFKDREGKPMPVSYVHPTSSLSLPLSVAQADTAGTGDDEREREMEMDTDTLEGGDVFDRVLADCVRARPGLGDPTILRPTHAEKEILQRLNEVTSQRQYQSQYQYHRQYAQTTMLLYKYRYWATSRPSLMVPFIRQVMWNGDPAIVREATRLLDQWTWPDLSGYLCLFGKDYSHSVLGSDIPRSLAIRRLALSGLSGMRRGRGRKMGRDSDRHRTDLQRQVGSHLMALVQGIQFDRHHGQCDTLSDPVTSEYGNAVSSVSSVTPEESDMAYDDVDSETEESGVSEGEREAASRHAMSPSHSPISLARVLIDHALGLSSPKTERDRETERQFDALYWHLKVAADTRRAFLVEPPETPKDQQKDIDSPSPTGAAELQRRKEAQRAAARDVAYLESVTSVYVTELERHSPSKAKRLRVTQSFVEECTALSSMVSALQISRPQKIQRLRELLTDAEQFPTLCGERGVLELPFFSTTFKASCVIPESGHVFKSNCAPILLRLEGCAECEGTTRAVLFKNGDNVMQDQIVLFLLDSMNRSLLSDNLDLDLTLYRVCATSHEAGFVEIVEPTMCLDDVLQGG